MNRLLRGMTILCIGTCLTQAVLITYFAVQGNVNLSTGTKAVALLNGIDITGERLERILNEAQDQEQPSFHEILEARKLKSLDMDLRLWSQDQYRGELNEMLTDLSVKIERFDERREAFDGRLEELEEGARDEGLQEMVRIIEEMEAEKAKDMLKRHFENDKTDEVVNIVQDIPSDKRRDILAAFESTEENDMLYQIIRRIGDGLPITSLIEQARGRSE